MDLVRDLGSVDRTTLERQLDEQLHDLRDGPTVVHLRPEDVWDAIEVAESHGFRIERLPDLAAADAPRAAEPEVVLAVVERPFWRTHR